MIIVTGAMGFIGSNLIKALNQNGIDEILAVDDLTNGIKFANLVDCKIADYIDKMDFLARIERGESFASSVKIIFHQGACSNTTEWNGKFMLDNNYQYSKALLHYSLERNVAFIYASSAAVYGNGNVFKEQLQYEKPLNVYGYSKFLFDQYVRKQLPNARSQIVGTRYFNVYGPREQHKGTMASVALHNHRQIEKENRLKLFKGCDGYNDGEQRRDFIYVEDVTAVNLWFMEHPQVSGIFNVGTGRSQTFNQLAHAVLQWHQTGEIEYITFPKHLQGCYQSFTEADLTQLRAVGCDIAFKSVEQGVPAYLDWLGQHNPQS